MQNGHTTDLPDSVKDVLPTAALDIYRQAFTSAWQQYGMAKRDESRAHIMAWVAVREHFHENEQGEWVEGADEPHVKRGLDERRIF